MKILFLDLDGTVRRAKSGATFINDPYDQELIFGVEKTLEQYRDWKIIGITNQGGVRAGFKTLKSCILEQQQTLSLVPQMTCVYFCPDDGKSCGVVSRGDWCWIVSAEWTPEQKEKWKPQFLSDDTNFRKPNTGMVEITLAAYPNCECLFVGDRPEDLQCAANAGIAFMWAAEWRNQK